MLFHLPQWTWLLTLLACLACAPAPSFQAGQRGLYSHFQSSPLGGTEAGSKSGVSETTTLRSSAFGVFPKRSGPARTGNLENIADNESHVPHITAQFPILPAGSEQNGANGKEGAFSRINDLSEALTGSASDLGRQEAPQELGVLWVAPSPSVPQGTGGLARLARRLAQLSAAEAQLRAQNGSLSPGESTVVNNFNLDSLGDPMGLVSCVPSCDEGNTCALVAVPSCTPNPDDNTGDGGCPETTEPKNLTWVCQPCREGEYCPANSLFTTNDGGRLDALQKSPDPLNVSSPCPMGSMCPRPGKRLDCPVGYFCPQGSKAPLTCSMPDLLNNNYTAKMLIPRGVLETALTTPFQGNFCPVNSTQPTVACPAGFYCPTPSEMLICPEDHYCPPLTHKPIPCRMLSYCPEGSATPNVQSFGTVVLIAALVVYLIFDAILNRIQLYLRHAEQQRQTLYSQLYTILNSQMDEKDQSDVRGIPPPDELISLSFVNLSLTLANGQVALEGVTGEIKHSRLVAVMGPSGSGKSTFLNALAGRASYGKVGGTVCVNGTVARMESYRSNIGFVPQDDIVYDDLTVRENLLYSARLRQPPGTAPQKIRRVVETTIRALQLGPVQNSVVGSVEKRGISGGQRKRVNVGIEMVATPALLFLDEPTSGLDATASWDIVYALKCLSRLGMTIVTVIHQPRYSIFNLFDDLLLLGRGGRTVFLGPSWLAVPYFVKLGWELPEGVNPADFVLDVVAGTEINRTNAQMMNTGLPAEWEKAVKAKWVETALETVPAPPQGPMRTHPPEMCTDAVDERRLINLVLTLLGQAHRERLIGLEDYDDEEEDEEAEGQGGDDEKASKLSGRPSTPPLLGRLSAESEVKVDDLEVLMDIYDMEPSRDTLERILLRAGAAFRSKTGAVTLEQLVQFLVADYQVHLSNHFHANRKALNRQQSLLENARSSMIKAKHAALAALPTSERLARTLESTDDENRGAMSWLFAKLGVAPSLAPKSETGSGPLVGMSSLPELDEKELSRRKSTVHHIAHDLGPHTSANDSQAESKRVAEPTPTSKAGIEPLSPGSGAEAPTPQTPVGPGGDPPDEHEKDTAKAQAIKKEATRKVAFKEIDSHMLPESSALSATGSQLSEATDQGYESCASEDDAAVPRTSEAGSRSPGPHKGPSTSHLSGNSRGPAPLASSHGEGSSETNPPDDRKAEPAPSSRPAGPHANAKQVLGEEAGGKPAPARAGGSGAAPSGTPGAGGRDPEGRAADDAKSNGANLNANSEETEDESEEGGLSGDEGGPAPPPSAARLRWIAAVRKIQEQREEEREEGEERAVQVRSPFAALAAASLGPSSRWSSFGARSGKVAGGGATLGRSVASTAPSDKGMAAGSSPRSESIFSKGLNALGEGLQWIILPFLACTSNADLLLARLAGLRSRGNHTSRMSPGAIQQFVNVTSRSFVQWMRHLNEVFTDIYLCIFVAYLLGLLLLTKADHIQTPITILTNQLAFALLTASGSLRVFSRHRTVFHREVSTGLRPLPYFLGQLLVDAINVVIRPFAFSFTLFAAFHRPAPFRGYYIPTLLTSWWASTLGYAISIYFTGTQALMILIILILIFGVVLAGVNPPTLVSMTANMPVITAFSTLSFNRWAVEAITAWEFAAWPEAFHHLALTRMLGIGFCGNEAYGMPAMSDLLDQLSNTTSVTSYDQALDAARVKFGNPVVDMLQCTLHTKVTHSDPNRNCVDYVCGKYVQRDWLILFGLGALFCVLAYIGMARVFVMLWLRLKFAAGRLIEACILKWLRPLLEKTRDGLEKGLFWTLQKVGAERLLPARVRARLDQKDRTRLLAEMLFANTMRRRHQHGPKQGQKRRKANAGSSVRVTAPNGSRMPARPRAPEN